MELVLGEKAKQTLDALLNRKERRTLRDPQAVARERNRLLSAVPSRAGAPVGHLHLRGSPADLCARRARRGAALSRAISGAVPAPGAVRDVSP
jgi:hypothetical protein